MVGSLCRGALLEDLTQCSSLVSTPQGDMGATGLVGAPGPKGEKGDVVSNKPPLCMASVGDPVLSPKHACQLEWAECLGTICL